MPKRPIRGLSAGANIIEEERRVMATGKLLMVKLTEEQREEKVRQGSDSHKTISRHGSGDIRGGS
jgi:hypothetical protein